MNCVRAADLNEARNEIHQVPPKVSAHAWNTLQSKRHCSQLPSMEHSKQYIWSQTRSSAKMLLPSERQRSNAPTRATIVNPLRPGESFKGCPRRQTTPQRSPLHYGVSSTLNQAQQFQRTEVSTDRSFNGIDTDIKDATTFSTALWRVPFSQLQRQSLKGCPRRHQEQQSHHGVLHCTVACLPPSTRPSPRSHTPGESDTYYDDVITFFTAQWRVLFPRLPFDKLFGQHQLKVKATQPLA